MNTENYKDIPGWGMDANPENEPTYPMKENTGDDHNRSNYERAPQQKPDVELLQSLERPEPSRVIGTTVPPSGLSGAIRRYAFQHSEDKVRHWIPLLMADRLQVWEGLVDDLKRGFIPNIVAERGWAAEWKHNPMGLLKKAAACATIALVVSCVLRRNKS